MSFGSPDRWSDVSLTDAQWARIEPLLPGRTPMRGGRWRDHREVIDAIALWDRSHCGCCSISGGRSLAAVRERSRRYGWSCWPSAGPMPCSGAAMGPFTVSEVALAGPQ
ncbi:transposase [Streptomyces antimycoticus]